MKIIKLTILLLSLPLTFYAQSLTGLWSGTLSNDSNTIRKDQSFEIVLTQYKDKVFGYSRMTFFVHDTLYYIVKRVKGTVEGDICKVKDDNILSHNFPRKPDKGVKLVSTFRRNQQDSIWRLDGDWKTTESKKHRFYSISGTIALETETDLAKSKLIPHLEELKMTDDIAVYQETKKAEQQSQAAAKQLTERTKSDLAVQKKPTTSNEGVKNEEIKKDEIVKAPVKSIPVVEAKQIIREENKQPATTAITVPKEEIAKTPLKTTPMAEAKQIVKEENTPPATAVTTPKQEIKKEEVAKVPVKSTSVAETKQTVKEEVIKAPVKLESVAATKPLAKEEQKIPVNTTTTQKNEPLVITKSVAPAKESTGITSNEKSQKVTNATDVRPVVSQAATFVTERKLAVPQSVFFKSDSLELALYDNGEVDGDTVSVLLNGELILAKQGLKTSAIRKTIYVPSGKMDSLTLVLYAENLGKYPPNTGLLVVHDGDDVYQVRFSADLQQNAAVIFKRKAN
jgi:hypothetical protein